ncbi:MAG: hypothetical protein ACREQF_03435 [Candidatus Binataceae bacterium]
MRSTPIRALVLKAAAAMAVCALAVGARTGRAAETPSVGMSRRADMQVLIRIADDDSSTSDGKRYARIAHEYYERVYEPVLERCATGRNPSSLPNFDVVITVGLDGAVHGLHVHPITVQAQCLANALIDARFPTPPKPQFHVHFASSFHR